MNNFSRIKEPLTLLGNYMSTKYGRSWGSRRELLLWQEWQVRRHLRYVLARSPYYREAAGGLPLEQWREFPVIDKREMMAHFDRLNTEGIGLEEALEAAWEAEKCRDFSPTVRGITVGLSSGTSGHRGVFLVSRQEQMAWAGTIMAKVLPGGLLQKHRVAFFLRANSNLYASVRKGRIEFQYFDLLEPIEKHVSQLNTYRPTLLVAPASVLRLLAEAVKTGALHIRPDKIVSVAEVLDPLDERYIGECFGRQVHQIYQCTEGFLGFTCSHGTLHLNEDLLVVEKEYLEGAERKFVPILTDFRRRTQPIIRYRLNDILTERKEPCPCGSKLLALEQIEGRSDDLFYLHSVANGRRKPVFPDFIRRAVLSASPEIEEYLIIQHSERLVECSLKVRPELEAVCREQVTRALTELCSRLHCHAPNIRYSEYVQGPRERKLRRVERRFAL
ncbi:F390 synthetase-related protein [Paenibacillus residui]|uniref:F390 synthetase-related protein n=1 Tax=Paenibacillus residui TaxID=629724 RepID=A0ABW3DH70_9BACL